ncbi:MAG: hypothetical protein J1F20_05300 [Muribaculaceae bacterium]|nr:hypothetical protein [Muribaculaceae bacterium]
MKAVMITYDQAHHEAVVNILTRTNNRGYTAWPQVTGRGTRTGDPHLGTHAWPTINAAIYTVVEDYRLKPLLDELQQLDRERPLLGIHAFVWSIEEMI